MRKTEHHGLASGAANSMIAYNLIPIPKLLAGGQPVRQPLSRTCPSFLP